MSITKHLRFVLGIVVLTSSPILTFGENRGKSEGEKTGVDSGLNKPLKVGAIFPLTGAVAPWGERLRVGLETANVLHGGKLSIEYEDEGPCVGHQALSAYRKLRRIDDIKVVFLGCLAGAESISPIAAKDDVLLLSLGLLTDSTLRSGARLVDLATEIGIESEYLATYVLREKPNRVAGLFFADAFGAEFSRVLAEQLARHGKPFVARDDADAQAQTFVPLILRWKKLGVDLLVTALSDRQQLTLYNEMKSLGFAPAVFSTYQLESYAPSKPARTNFEGIRYTHPVNSSEDWVETRKLIEELAKREKQVPGTNINALFAYDGVKFLLEGLTSCREVDPSCLYNYFTLLGNRTGVSGEMRFKQTGALTRPYGLKIVKNGEFEWIDRAGLGDSR